MELKDLIYYTVEVSKYLALAGASHYLLVEGLNRALMLSENIRNEKALDGVIEEESKNLGLKKTIISKLTHNTHGYTRRLSGRKYRVSVGGKLATRGAVRHELYHIHKGDCDALSSKLKYLLIQEPRASLYALFGVKL